MSCKRKGFSTPDLIVSLSIIAVLMALLLPAIQMVRESSRRASCGHNLRQLAIATHSHHDINGYLPDTSRFPPSGPVDTGWGPLAKLLPFVEESVLYNKLDLERRTGHPTNSPLLDRPIAIYRCPSDPGSESFDAKLSSDAVRVASCTVTFVDSVAGDHSQASLAQITDGLSQTLLAGERTITESGKVTWSGILCDGFGCALETEATLPVIAETRPGSPIDLLGKFESHHVGGVSFVLCDGSVTFVSNDIDATTWEKLGTPSNSR